MMSTDPLEATRSPQCNATPERNRPQTSECIAKGISMDFRLISKRIPSSCHETSNRPARVFEDVSMSTFKTSQIDFQIHNHQASNSASTRLRAAPGSASVSAEISSVSLRISWFAFSANADVDPVGVPTMVLSVPLTSLLTPTASNSI